MSGQGPQNIFPLCKGFVIFDKDRGSPLSLVQLLPSFCFTLKGKEDLAFEFLKSYTR